MQLKELLNIEQPVSLNSLPVDQMKDLQGALANLGYPVGDIDGLVGPRTRSAWSEFQNDVSKRDRRRVGCGVATAAGEAGAAIEPRLFHKGWHHRRHNRRVQATGDRTTGPDRLRARDHPT